MIKWLREFWWVVLLLTPLVALFLGAIFRAIFKVAG